MVVHVCKDRHMSGHPHRNTHVYLHVRTDKFKQPNIYIYIYYDDCKSIPRRNGVANKAKDGPLHNQIWPNVDGACYVRDKAPLEIDAPQEGIWLWSGPSGWCFWAFGCGVARPVVEWPNRLSLPEALSRSLVRGSKRLRPPKDLPKSDMEAHQFFHQKMNAKMTQIRPPKRLKIDPKNVPKC